MKKKSLLASSLVSAMAFSSLLALVPDDADAFGCGSSNRRGPSYSGRGYDRDWRSRRGSSSGFVMGNQRDYPSVSSYGFGRELGWVYGYQYSPGGYGNPGFGRPGYGPPRGYRGAGFNLPGGPGGYGDSGAKPTE